MGLLRPARRVTGPNGDSWELYVSKTALPAWVPISGFEPGVEAMDPEIALLELPVMILSFLWTSIVVPLVRFCFLLPLAVVRGRRSHAVRIEAMCPYPREEIHLWLTTDVHAKRVLDEIAAGLAEGKILQPEGAVYTGPE